MAQMNFGGVMENVITRDEFPLEKAREILKDETIAVIGYGVQGPGQSQNLRDNGFNVIVGQRPGKTFEKAIADGWVPGETLFGIEEACEKGTIVMCLLSDAAVMSVWPRIKSHMTAGKTLYFSHGFAITWNDRTGVTPPEDIDVNGHVNSIKYIEHILNLFSMDYYKEHTIERFEIAYVAESYFGDKLTFFCQQKGEGEYDVEVKKNDTEVVVRSKLKFR